MKNIEFENKCKDFFNNKKCYLNQNFQIEFVYNDYSIYTKLVNQLDNKFPNWCGHCNVDSKRIFINMRTNNSSDYMFEVFIHEMAHSMQFKLGHNREFAKDVKRLGGILTTGGR